MSQKDARQLRALLRKQGFVVTRLRSGRYRVTHPGTRESVVIPQNPNSDTRTLKNAQAAVRRIGADV